MDNVISYTNTYVSHIWQVQITLAPVHTVGGPSLSIATFNINAIILRTVFMTLWCSHHGTVTVHGIHLTNSAN